MPFRHGLLHPFFFLLLFPKGDRVWGRGQRERRYIYVSSVFTKRPRGHLPEVHIHTSPRKAKLAGHLA